VTGAGGGKRGGEHNNQPKEGRVGRKAPKCNDGNGSEGSGGGNCGGEGDGGGVCCGEVRSNGGNDDDDNDEDDDDNDDDDNNDDSFGDVGGGCGDGDSGGEGNGSGNGCSECNGNNSNNGGCCPQLLQRGKLHLRCSGGGCGSGGGGGDRGENEEHLQSLKEMEISLEDTAVGRKKIVWNSS